MLDATTHVAFMHLPRQNITVFGFDTIRLKQYCKARTPLTGQDKVIIPLFTTKPEINGIYFSHLVVSFGISSKLPPWQTVTSHWAIPICIKWATNNLVQVPKKHKHGSQIEQNKTIPLCFHSDSKNTIFAYYAVS
jgi:hypothetical protein